MSYPGPKTSEIRQFEDEHSETCPKHQFFETNMGITKNVNSNKSIHGRFNHLKIYIQSMTIHFQLFF